MISLAVVIDLVILGSIKTYSNMQIVHSNSWTAKLVAKIFDVSLAFDGIAARKLNQTSAFGAWVWFSFNFKQF